MLMSQRYPLYFDGVVAGAPAMRTGHSNLATRTVTVNLNRSHQKVRTASLPPEVDSLTAIVRPSSRNSSTSAMRATV